MNPISWFKNKEIKITHFFLSGSIAIITILLVISAFFWIKNKYNKLKNEYTITQIKFVENQRNIIKNETERAIDYINFNIKQSEENLKDRIQKRVENAYDIENQIYNQNKNYKTNAEIERMIIDVLRPIRFDKNNSYSVTKLNGTNILCPVNTAQEGKNILNVKDDLGNPYIQKEINLIKNKKEGFLISSWNCIDTVKVSEKIAYIKLFEPLNFYISVNEYYLDYLDEIQKETLLWLTHFRFGKQGYIFVNTYKGDALLMDGKIVTEKRNVWNLEDPNGVKVIQLERKAVKNPKGDFIFYSWRRLTDSVIIPKMSFVKGVPEWRWMVGAGVYIEDIDAFLAKKDKELKKIIIRDSLYIVVMVLVVFLMLIILIVFISNNLKKNITRFIDFFKNATKKYHLIDKSKITYTEFKTIADYANKMIADLKVSETRSEEEKAHYKRLFNQSPEAIAYIDNDGKVIRINSAFTKLFGYNQSELKGDFLDNFIVPDNLKDEAVNYTKNIESGETNPIEAIRINKNNERLYINIIGSPVKINNKQLGIYVVYRDITDQKRFEQTLHDAKLKAEESDRLKTSFLTNLSHEIRTPLNAIIGFSSLLNTKEYSKETQKNYLNILQNSGNNLLEIIDNIVDLSKIQSSTLVITKNKVNFNTLLDSIYFEYKELLTHQENNTINLICNKQFQESELQVYTDPKRIKQIFSNLLDNAIKFTSEGNIEFGYSIKENVLHCYVKDTGIGIEENNISFIFNLFRQVDESPTRKYGGTGTGLALCKGLINLLNGNIYIESNVGKGTQVYFNIPVETTKQEVKTESIQPKKDLHNWKDKKILIAEDDDANFKLLQSFLEKTSVTIKWVKNGQEVLDVLDTDSTYDLILMDINMPKMNGNDSLLQLRKKGIHVPVIAQTAYAMDDEKDHILQIGYNDYISKPISYQVFLNILSKYLN